MGAWERERAKRVRHAEELFGELSPSQRRAAADGSLYVDTTPKEDGAGYRTVMMPFVNGTGSAIVVSSGDTGSHALQRAYDVEFKAQRGLQPYPRHRRRTQ